MTDKELASVAVDIVDRRVFCSWMIAKDQPSLMPTIFMPMSIGPESRLPDDVSCLYEYLDKAMPITVDGYPVFFSFKFLTVEQRERLAAMIDRYRSMKQEILD